MKRGYNKTCDLIRSYFDKKNLNYVSIEEDGSAAFKVTSGAKEAVIEVFYDGRIVLEGEDNYVKEELFYLKDSIENGIPYPDLILYKDHIPENDSANFSEVMLFLNEAASCFSGGNKLAAMHMLGAAAELLIYEYARSKDHVLSSIYGLAKAPKYICLSQPSEIPEQEKMLINIYNYYQRSKNEKGHPSTVIKLDQEDINQFMNYVAKIYQPTKF